MTTVTTPTPEVTFVRLTEVPLDDLVALLDEPRNARHLPLAGGPTTRESTAAWVRSKDQQWETAGYGPWAVLLDGVFAGWGGFQREEHGPDLALVLRPACWGAGELVTRAALQRGFDELGFDAVTIALPRSRNPERVVGRLGFVPAGEVVHDGVPFRLFRLTREVWRR
ncbi:Protein N-acetyltransferase, RimJ/RimL family [Friedmanniella luteola]|uniref:Protein N-acetyltransferase, RimJ/RimL family n=1 Tax=Friedmanniella luteola TaxID=546871 RepID=A0A1H1XID4_9ACTN|nr:GNAT family N-acetyltransferase [Friedmanniella luteola]SDT09024.1 Protein N-acetyltransferase, RimJ/RimL family [Friedmanniella luteola]